MRDKKWLKSPWTISIATAIFSLFLTIGYDYLKNKPILSTIYQIIKVVWNFLISVLNYKLKVWWLFLGIFIIFIVIYLIYKFSVKESIKPDFYNYTEEFRKWKWTWNWKWHDLKNAWVISDLTVHCPTCDTPLIEYPYIYGLEYGCPRCDYRTSDIPSDEPHKIEMIILDNIRRKRKNNNSGLNL